MGADLGAEAVLERGDDPAAVRVVLGVRAGDQQHVQRQPQRVAADLDVALLHDVEQRDLDPLGEVGQLVDRDDAAVRARDQAEVDGLGVAERAALGDLHRVDVADQVGDGGVRGGELLGVALVAVPPVDGQVVAQLGGAAAGRRGDRLVAGARRARSRRSPGVHSSSRPASARSRRVLPWPRSPSRTTSCPASRARSSCGSTVDSKPRMPGHGSAPARSAASRLSRISALTLRGAACSEAAQRAEGAGKVRGGCQGHPRHATPRSPGGRSDHGCRSGGATAAARLRMGACRPSPSPAAAASSAATSSRTSRSTGYRGDRAGPRPDPALPRRRLRPGRPHRLRAGGRGAHRRRRRARRGRRRRAPRRDPGARPDHQRRDLRQQHHRDLQRLRRRPARPGSAASCGRPARPCSGLPFDDARRRTSPSTRSTTRARRRTYSLVKTLEEEMARQFCRWEPELTMIGLRFSNVMDPSDYAAFPAFDADPRLRRWNLWGYIDARDGAQAVRLALEQHRGRRRRRVRHRQRRHGDVAVQRRAGRRGVPGRRGHPGPRRARDPAVDRQGPPRARLRSRSTAGGTPPADGNVPPRRGVAAERVVVRPHRGSPRAAVRPRRVQHVGGDGRAARDGGGPRRHRVDGGVGDQRLHRGAGRRHRDPRPPRRHARHPAAAVCGRGHDGRRRGGRRAGPVVPGADGCAGAAGRRRRRGPGAGHGVGQRPVERRGAGVGPGAHRRGRGDAERLRAARGWRVGGRRWLALVGGAAGRRDPDAAPAVAGGPGRGQR